MNTNPSFNFQTEVLDGQGNIRIDVYAHALPSKFLGAAFNLDLNAQNWDYQKYELAPLLGPDKNLLSLVAKKENPEKIIFGVSLKRGSSLKTFDGKLVSFFVKLSESDFAAFSQSQETPLRLNFRQGVLSVYEKGRKDLAEAGWENGSSALVYNAAISDASSSVSSTLLSSAQVESPGQDLSSYTAGTDMQNDVLAQSENVSTDQSTQFDQSVVGTRPGIHFCFCGSGYFVAMRALFFQNEKTK